MSNTLQLATPRLTLRRWQPSDRVPFAAMNADPVVMTYFAAPLTSFESNETISRYTANFARDGFSFFAAEHNDTQAFVGVIGLQIMRDIVPKLPQPAIEIGWRLAREHHGQGLATEGARAIVNYAFNELHLPQVVAITAVGNINSRRVMEKLGMTHDPALDFDHPRMPDGHPHQRHVLYALQNPASATTQEAACVAQS